MTATVARPAGVARPAAAAARRARRSPFLTRSGLALLVGVVVVAVVGVVLRYTELVVLAAAGMAVLLVAILVPRFATPIAVERQLPRRLVQRGQDVNVQLVVRSDARQSPLRLFDRLGQDDVVVDVPALAPGESTRLGYHLPAVRRGLHLVGPVIEERTDPLGLVVRQVSHELTDQVWVHPVVHPLSTARFRPGLSLGRRRVLGTVQDPTEEFRALRDYVPGDDPRRIHWPSTARTGELVVRDQAESRRETRLILLETAQDSATAAEFEEAVEIAASLAMHALQDGIVVIVRTRARHAPGLPRPVVSREQVLELFSVVERTSARETLAVRDVAGHAAEVERVHFVTGPTSPVLGELTSRARLRPKLSVVRVATAGTPLGRVRGHVMDVRTASEFALRWSGR